MVKKCQRLQQKSLIVLDVLVLKGNDCGLSDDIPLDLAC